MFSILRLVFPLAAVCTLAAMLAPAADDLSVQP
jgi:hypothetical protein